MAYTPDPSDVTQPDDSVKASTAAAEFRALKAYILGGSYLAPVGASAVGYQPAGTGAVATTVQAAIRRIFVSSDGFISTSNTAAQNVAGWALLKTYVDSLATGAHVQVSRGTYLFNASIARSRKMLLCGEGKFTTLFSFSHVGNGITSTEAIDSSTSINFGMRDIGFINTSGANTGAGFVDVGGTFIDLYNVYFKDWKYNTILDQSEMVTIRKCHFETWVTAGIWIVNGPEYSAGADPYYTNRIVIDDNQFNAVSAIGRGVAIADDGGTNHTITNNNMNGGELYLAAAGVFGLIFEGNECEAAAGVFPVNLTQTKYASGAIQPCQGFSISKNVIGGGSYGTYLTAAHNGKIEANTYFGFTTAAIDYDFASTGRVSGVDISANTKIITGAGGRTAFPFFAAARYQSLMKQGNVTQLDQYYVVAALAATGSQVITLPSAIDGIAPGAVLKCANDDGTASEDVRVTAVSGLTFTATFASTKTAYWTVRVISSGWLPVASGASTNTPGSWTYTANTQHGTFSQVKNRVKFTAALAWTVAGGTGQLQVSLPVTASNTTNFVQSCSCTVLGAAGVVTGTVVANINPGASVVAFAVANPATGNLTQVTSYATGTVYVSGEYEV